MASVRSAMRQPPQPSLTHSSTLSSGDSANHLDGGASVDLAASYYSSLADSAADRHTQAKEDAGKEEDSTVAGGKADRRVLSSTDNSVRVIRSQSTAEPHLSVRGSKVEGRVCSWRRRVERASTRCRTMSE